MSKRKVTTAGWRHASPIFMANKTIACFTLQEIGVKNLMLIPDKRLKDLFLNSYIENGENGEEIEVFEIDWEFVLFCATDYEIGKVLDFFQSKQQVPTEEVVEEATSASDSKVFSLKAFKNEERVSEVKERIIIEKK